MGEGVSGAGLGLSIAKEIIELHGGRLAIQSPPPDRERGTRVSISLPTAIPPTVLVADDDETTRKLLEQQLGSCGYHVIACADAARALDLTRQAKPDVSVLGVSTTVVDGEDLVCQMKSDQSIQAVQASVRPGNRS